MNKLRSIIPLGILICGGVFIFFYFAQQKQQADLIKDQRVMLTKISDTQDDRKKVGNALLSAAAETTASLRELLRRSDILRQTTETDIPGYIAPRYANLIPVEKEKP